MSALDKVTNDFYTSENVRRCSWCDYEEGHAGNCQQELAQAELATLRAERDEAVRLLTAINEIGKRDLSNQKYDGYFESIREFLAKVKP